MMKDYSTFPDAAQKGKLSFGESLDMAVKITGAITVALAKIISYPITSPSEKHPELFRHVVYAFMRRLLSSLSIRQLRMTSTTTEEAYNIIAMKENFTPYTVTIDSDGTKAHWLGDSTSDKVFLYFPGGGYCVGGNELQLRIAWDIVKAAGGKIAAMILSYDLAPEHPYPRQLAQAARAVQYLLSEGKSPSDIIIGGDSAGGHLALSLLLHISQPHSSPTVPAISLQSSLLACVLISPGVSLDGCNPPSTLARDTLTPKGTERWASAYRGAAKRDPYNSPVTAPKEWWRTVPIQKMLIVGGADEFLAGAIIEISSKIKSVHSNTLIFMGPGEEHEAIIAESFLGYKEKPQSATVLERWMREILK
ncbi:Alpha/Beta hydrolase protein [Xylogone sp. PMI_703]|nr:Alpha/Beta hydrolase protein [Xylogone sp. PMI_703]